MRLLTLLALFLAPVVVCPAHADTPTIKKTGIPQQDRVFGEVANINAVLSAAEKRMDTLERQVTEPLGLPAGTTLEDAVYAIKKRSNGDVKTMNAGGRTILFLGGSATSEVKEAASALNEGTQELSVIAADIQKLPGRLADLQTQSGGLKPTSSTLADAGIPADQLADLEAKYTHNHLLTKYTGERASAISGRAQTMMGAVDAGMARAIDTAPEPAPAPAPQPVVEPAPAPAPVATAAPKPAPRPRSNVPTIGDTLQKAWLQFKDAEIDNAVDILANAENLLLKQERPVARSELIELFQLRALVNIVKGDAATAAWSATQALVIHPNAVPESKLGPNYAKLHKALQKAQLVQRVDVRASGSGRAYLSGIEVTGGATLLLGQGQHLLQVERADGSWDNSVVYVKDGFVVEF